jgi:hypothetical protein
MRGRLFSTVLAMLGFGLASAPAKPARVLVVDDSPPAPPPTPARRSSPAFTAPQRPSLEEIRAARLREERALEGKRQGERLARNRSRYDYSASERCLERIAARSRPTAKPGEGGA